MFTVRSEGLAEEITGGVPKLIKNCVINDYCTGTIERNVAVQSTSQIIYDNSMKQRSHQDENIIP